MTGTRHPCAGWPLALPGPRGWPVGIRLRYEIDSVGLFRQHLHLVEEAGYFFFPGAAAAQGTGVTLLVAFAEGEQDLVLRGQVWTRPAPGGMWLEFPRARRCLAALGAAPRAHARVPTGQLVLVEAAGRPALLCRLGDVSAGGARLLATAADVGDSGHPLRIALPEASPGGEQLQAFGTVAWSGGGEIGVEWDRGSLASRPAVLRLLQLAGEEWEARPSVTHPATCRCRKAQRRVLLLG